MTPEEIQELRDWSARKMGWYLDPKTTLEPNYRNVANMFAIYVKDWHPDTDLNQCFLLVEKMREEGFYLRLDDNTDNHYIADFYDDNGLFYRDSKGSGFSDNPALAIIMAAKATEETNE